MARIVFIFLLNFFFIFILGRGGFEPPRLAAYGPEPYVSAVPPPAPRCGRQRRLNLPVPLYQSMAGISLL